MKPEEQLLRRNVYDCFSLYTYIRREGEKERNVKVAVLVSKGCHNKLLQTRWLTTTEMYSLTALEIRSLKSRCHQGFAPSGGSREESFLSLAASCGCQQYSTHPGLWRPNSKFCLHPHMTIFLLCMSVCKFLFPYKGTNHWVRTPL